MDELKIETSPKKATKSEGTTFESSKVPATSEAACLRKIKHRTIVFRSHDKNFCRLKKLVYKEIIRC